MIAAACKTCVLRAPRWRTVKVRIVGTAPLGFGGFRVMVKDRGWSE